MRAQRYVLLYRHLSNWACLQQTDFSCLVEDGAALTLKGSDQTMANTRGANLWTAAEGN